MIKIIRYNDDLKEVWDNFIEKSINPLFMFKRNYMDYHRDLFADHSLLVYRKGRLIALLPANEFLKDRHFASHGALTFGGLIFSMEAKTQPVLESLGCIIDYLRSRDFNLFTYKKIPHIYHSLPAEEDLYALYRFGAKLKKVEPSGCIDLQNMPKAKHCDSKGRNLGLSMEKSEDFEGFWDILSSVLEKRHGIVPTHSCAEILDLYKKFPEDIALYTVKDQDEIVSGALLFIYENLVHTQYLASSKKGFDCGAMDFLIAELVQQFSSEKRYFDFGISTEDNGLYLNEGLVRYKERHGARTIVHSTWEIGL